MTHRQFAELVAEMRAAQIAWGIVKGNRVYSEMPQQIAHCNCMRLEAAVDAALFKMNDKDFEQYVEEVKQEFVTAANALEWNTETRTKCETLLIAYDQMKDKLF